MKKTRKQMLTAFLLSTSLVVGALSFPLTSVKAEDSSILKLRLLETTDLHTNIVNYDYYQDKVTDEFGLAKTATLIKKARDEATNSILIDNGDLLQGNPLGDYVAKIDPLKDGETHPVYKAMNLLNYDVGNIGNHEFNFGLDHLNRSLKGAKFPYINANVYADDKDKNPDNDKNLFTPYQILERKFKDESGKEVTLKVGVIGFVPPQIMMWDKSNLEGKVIAKDILETANKFIPEMKQKGADIIVAVPHSGLGPVETAANLENASYQLSKIDGIDAILFGHSHLVFPGPGFDSIPGVDASKGTINGKPAVMPGYWGNNLGVIDLTLTQVNGKWKVAESATKAVPIYDKAKKASLADADPSILDAVKDEHDHTVKWVRSAVGKTTSPIYSYFALVQDDPSIQIVTNAQTWFVEKNIKGTEYDGIPVLSAGAPFKAGGRNGVSYYSNIPAGTIAIKNVSDLYIYPNTLKAVLINGSQVKEWLERSAGQFNQIDVKKKEEQPLVNEMFPTYNFDVIDGVTYQIDVTQPNKYAIDGTVANKNANRIKNLAYKGKPVKATDKYIVVTNNYRASGGGAFPGLDGKNIIIDSPDENRQVVIDYILSQKNINPAADNNWTFAPINGKANVTFTSAPEAKQFVKNTSKIKFINVLESGFAKYSIDLSKPVQAEKPVKPTTPAKPAIPAKPTTPGKSDKPGKPATPAKPAAPGKSDKSGKPATPAKPAAPGKSDKSGKPATPAKPAAPGKSDKSDKSGKPATPAKPVKPATK
ncbi:bifunctional 2',3'-cyclic-nucleotide 2'-phosphodiesterase/3'-nucleotidase [Paenibacillus sp. ACRRX]|uniref:bifunctional 2',3'-cyclic-nucleotide 2'-phosphodiesterase/3'-nucleotidase n=1 Tax=Paenibacillus sp. ACRRX TaxID=2918206 RepID=UPI001EF558BA|nr:bifunctional 2',3'-cyclic-nucleotide 2'-phosphodiesterase/3'-nucleotidase [Paenibacillus sp. ACRRX]MCG7408806.1 bifunctional 2',3'-cyclic-nucleotide 2'-phosphodiesterase/3'-nucleotidase [Paenibacillus sp. ACRRX]